MMLNDMHSCILLLWLLSLHGTSSSQSTPEGNTSCMASQREALLEFKAGIIDQKHRLSSWRGEHCCQWRGVRCSSRGGYVIKLKLRNTHGNSSQWLNDELWALQGDISPSLLSLHHLNHLDLSFNKFNGTRIPEFIGSFKNLKYLNLSTAYFSGTIPPQLGNLSKLQYLDLSNKFRYFDLNSGDVSWLSNLSALRHLDLSWVNLTEAKHWLHAVISLPSLIVLNLRSCDLQAVPTSPSYVNFTALTNLDLADNRFVSRLPEWLWSLSNLTYLDLSNSGFHGTIPVSLSNLTALEVLRMGDNNFQTTMPEAFRNLCNLHTLNLASNGISQEITNVLPQSKWSRMQELDLSSNRLTGSLSGWLEKMMDLKFLYLFNSSLRGSIPAGIANLSKLEILELEYNFLDGTVTESFFVNMTRLQILSLSSNSLFITIADGWVPSFQLQTLLLRSCRIGPRFPAWLQRQQDILYLDLSNTGIVDTVPNWFWNSSSAVQIVLSHNQISGEVPELSKLESLEMLDLSFNRLEGPIPPLPNKIGYVDLSNNAFSGPLEPSLITPYLDSLSLANNPIGGSIPSSICGRLEYLDLSNCSLSGELPHCHLGSILSILNLADNNLSGEVFDSIGNLSLHVLQLRNNKFSGEITTSLQFSMFILFLDIGENKLTGNVPSWIGEKLPDLMILRLRSNMFAGHIPAQLSLLDNLQVLDLSNNELSGPIPPGFGNFTAMVSTEVGNLDTSASLYLYAWGSVLFTYDQELLLVVKGRELEYPRIPVLLNTIDLSSNNLLGVVPGELGALLGLKNLNLSTNHLFGRIPEEMGRLKSLESLDLSMNNLSGTIPQSLSALNFLSHLNLSYNNLSGRIPTGNQLQTLYDPSIYAGNAGLCGPPLTESCNTINEGSQADEESEEDESEMLWVYIGAGTGFVAGLWALLGILILNKAWRNAYFQFIDDMYEKMFVIVVVNLTRLKRLLDVKKQII